jgi:hypothetical protein
MILLSLLFALQYFITGTTTMPKLEVFVAIIIGATVETLMELKILSIKSKEEIK